MSTRPRARALALALALTLPARPACLDPEPGLGHLRLHLEAERCAAFCLETLRVSLYDAELPDLPLGPPLQVTCGAAPLLFSSLPAGLVVSVAVDAYDATGELLLSGRSAPTTVAAGRQTDLEVTLTAPSPPTITSAAPEPYLLGSDTPLTLEGQYLEPLGDHAALLDDTPLTSATWSPSDAPDAPDQLSLTLDTTATGSALTVRRCGVPSAPFPVRLVADSAGAAPVAGLPLCPGGAPTAAALSVNTVHIAWRCDDPASAVLLHYRLDDALCPLDPAGSTPLSANPHALVAAPSGVWVARELAPTLYVPLSAPVAGDPSLPYPAQPDEVLALALTADQPDAFALLSTGSRERLLRLSPDATVAALDLPFSELRHHALVGDPRSPRLFLAASTAAGDARLVALPLTGTPTAWPLPCASPSALAIAPDGAHLAIACAPSPGDPEPRDEPGGRLVLWDLATSTARALALAPPRALAFDDASDLVFGASDSLALITLGTGPTGPTGSADEDTTPSLLATLPVAADLLLPLGAHRLLARSGAELRVLTPFSRLGPCGGPSP